ncbi:MAG: hypothetical protein GY854_00430 [Deltaproteobacteria bacterium]|nr:hypothetical protein [Deltaproteobacteria bacterium]
MTGKAKLPGVLTLAILLTLTITSQAQDGIGSMDGEGIDSQILWPTPGPSNFPTILSSDIVGHTGVTFSALFGYYRKPLGIENTDEDNTDWVVKNAFAADFLWAFGIIDYFQIGLALPVVLDQDGVGATPFKPLGAEDADYSLASSALRDIRFNAKARLLGGKAEMPDRRDFGLAIDLGLAVPTGDEINFAGDEGVVFFPTAVVDFHRCKFSAALNLGARIRSDKSDKLADLSVGHQGTVGLGVTGHLFQRKLLLSLEGLGLVEFDGFDRLGLEYRGGVGYIPDDARSVTLWVAGGSSTGTGDLLGTPLLRVLVGITYSPGADDETLDAL